MTGFLTFITCDRALMTACHRLMLAVIIPTYKAGASVGPLLSQIVAARRDVRISTLIVSEAVTTNCPTNDGTLGIALRHGAQIALGFPGRGVQMARAVTLAADADWYLFLHADSILPDNWDTLISAHVRNTQNVAAYFTLSYDSTRWQARIVEAFVRLRNWAWGLPYGDQGLLISRAHYEAIGGYGNMPLFEDVDIVKRIGKRNLQRLRAKIITSGEKYERDGFLRRGWRNFRLLMRYSRGESVSELVKSYR